MNKMREQLRKIKWVLFFVALEFVTIETLVFPRYSVMQITAAFSIPVELSHERKFFFDWGFQQNYDLPWNSSSFYNIPIWPGFKDNKVRQRRDLKYEVSQEGVHPNDFTAGEFYEALESLLVSYGFHETCLLKSVCQLARHPFDENHNNVLNEILTFILSPSIHQAFSKNEKLYQAIYERAERMGFGGEKCDMIYFECKQDLLDLLTNVVFKDN
ncbi:hypothetical protein ACFFRR_001015 [Megaselia abdita]